ncbi:MAG: MBL fold metallo-hydrolase [Candidatus Omnitrophica bacterium]|nr:MBL fold metallo-hydrolase [Candidatus Omnitrophota bacterium]
MKKLLICALFLALTTSISYAQRERDFSKTVIQTTRVNESVYMLEGEGGNIALSIGADGVLMIDDQFAELHKKIMTAINELSTAPIKFLINTHWHGDHTGGNELMNATGTHIIAHDNVRQRLSTKQIRKMLERISEARDKEALPVLTFKESIKLHFNDETIDVMHFQPGHTDGDSVIFFQKANVVHMGDLFFNGRYPFIDLDSGGDVDGYIQSVQTVLDKISEDAQIIPGHGPLGTKKDLQVFYNMLQSSRQLIQKAVAEKKSLEEIQQLELPEAFQEGWGSGFVNKERWFSTLYAFYAQN